MPFVSMQLYWRYGTSKRYSDACEMAFQAYHSAVSAKVRRCITPQDMEGQRRMLLVVSLIVLGGLVLLLGCLALLVVCSGINNLSDDPSQPGAGGVSHPAG